MFSRFLKTIFEREFIFVPTNYKQSFQECLEIFQSKNILRILSTTESIEILNIGIIESIGQLIEVC